MVCASCNHFAPTIQQLASILFLLLMIFYLHYYGDIWQPQSIYKEGDVWNDSTLWIIITQNALCSIASYMYSSYSHNWGVNWLCPSHIVSCTIRPQNQYQCAILLIVNIILTIVIIFIYIQHWCHTFSYKSRPLALQLVATRVGVVSRNVAQIVSTASTLPVGSAGCCSGLLPQC